VPTLLQKTGDLWKGLLGKQRFDLYALATPSET
jgi:hypothetical protein